MSVRLQVMRKTKKGGKSPLGEKISQLALARGFKKPSDFAHAHEINLGTFNDLLYGKTRIYPDSLVAVARGLGKSPAELLALAESESNVDVGENLRNAGKENKANDRAENTTAVISNNAPKRSRSDLPNSSTHNLMPTHTLASDVAMQVITALRSSGFHPAYEFNPAKPYDLSPSAVHGPLSAADYAAAIVRLARISPERRAVVLAFLFDDPSLLPDDVEPELALTLAKPR